MELKSEIMILPIINFICPFITLCYFSFNFILLIRNDTWVQKDKYLSDDNQPFLEMKYLEGTTNVVIALGDTITNNIGGELFTINAEKLR